MLNGTRQCEILTSFRLVVIGLQASSKDNPNHGFSALSVRNIAELSRHLSPPDFKLRMES